ncbi:MAG: tRNA 4-thiouridine(8) synthase ThiI, partial [Stygiolobus sp.]|nr:tRNA 4-thiouridine(8) synthase ThiI [Stygiolobus sp.]
MTTLILTLTGEIAIKSERTRKRFEHLLLNNISKVLNIKSYKFEQGLILIETEDDFRKLEKVFGIAHFYKAERIEFG